MPKTRFAEPRGRLAAEGESRFNVKARAAAASSAICVHLRQSADNRWTLRLTNRDGLALESTSGITRKRTKRLRQFDARAHDGPVIKVHWIETIGPQQKQAAVADDRPRL